MVSILDKLFLFAAEINLFMAPQRSHSMKYAQAFKVKYPSTRVVIDSMEELVHQPKLQKLQQMTFSSSNSNTYKTLISPDGVMIFVLLLYQGLF